MEEYIQEIYSSVKFVPWIFDIFANEKLNPLIAEATNLSRKTDFFIIKNNIQWINFHEPMYGLTALHVSSAVGNPELTRYLLENGANPEEEDIFGNTALHYASIEGNIEIARVLVEFEAVVNKENGQGKTPLYYSLMYPSLAKFYLDGYRKIGLTKLFSPVPARFIPDVFEKTE